MLGRAIFPYGIILHKGSSIDDFFLHHPLLENSEEDSMEEVYITFFIWLSQKLSDRDR